MKKHLIFHLKLNTFTLSPNYLSRQLMYTPHLNWFLFGMVWNLILNDY